jgi:hypothetical protein
MRPSRDYAPTNLKRRSGRRAPLFPAIGCLMFSLFIVLAGRCQTSTAQPRSDAPDSADESQRMAEIEHRLDAVTSSLADAQQALQKSLLEIQTLRGQLDSLRAQSAPASQAADPLSAHNQPPDRPGNAADVGVPLNDDLKGLHEEQDALQAEVKQHEQIKVESASKYSLRLTGLILFNAFSNAGVVDNVDLPTFALPRQPGRSHGSAGATLQQTLVGLEGTGPTIGGARTFADVSMDFFGGTTTNAYGYSYSTGAVRMRQAQISLDWPKTTLQAAYTVPLISPLSPTSYATVAQPGFSSSGNLWTWSPQVRLEQRFPLSDDRSISLEGGLIDPESPGYSSAQLDSPVEASRRPGYEGRVSYRANSSWTGSSHRFVLGAGGYSASQYYSSSTQIHSWAATLDWQVPILKWFEVTGEAYRGRALGGLGGGLYKDVVVVTNPVTGLPQTNGIETVGGWTQLKLRLHPTLEANAAFGIDDAISGNFYGLISTPGANPLQQYARNNSVMGNLIFRPKTYLIFSPEYRHLLTWPYTGPVNVANVFTFSAGYQF